MRVKANYIICSIIIICSLSGCSSKRPQLIVDEIYLSKHVVGPPIKYTIRSLPSKSGRGPVVAIDSITPAPFCFKAVNISHSDYNAKLIIKVNKEGKLQGYYKNCISETEGYYETMLPDSMIAYFNSQIYKMNYRKYKTTVYYDTSFGTLYCGPEYFVYLKKNEEAKLDFCFNKYKSPKNIISFIDSMYNYLSNVNLKEAPSTYFRRDTLIVLRTEQISDSLEKIYYRKE